MTDNKLVSSEQPPKPPQQQSTELAEGFEPTNGMIRWFEAAVEAGHTATISDIARQAGLDRTNWYLWLKKPGFVEWWDKQWGQFLRVNRWKLDAIGMKQAERNFDYWQAMMERTGNLRPKESGGIAQQINIGLRGATADIRKERGLDVDT